MAVTYRRAHGVCLRVRACAAFPDDAPPINLLISTSRFRIRRNYLSWHGTQAQLVIAEPELIKENMVPSMVDIVHGMLERWRHQEGKEIDVFEDFKLFTGEVISRTAFGSSYVEGGNIFQTLTRLGVLLAKNASHVRFPGLSKFWKTVDEFEAEKLEKGIYDAILGIIKKREEKMKAGEAADFGNDFLGQLVKASRNTDKSKKITIDDLVDQCKTFYIAGQESTTALMTWVVFLLATHPDWQEEARKEVLHVFGNDDPDSDGIGKLKMISMIINETLRLYPPVIGLTRQVEQQLGLGKLVLPANVQILVGNLKLHHDPGIWGEDVHLFKPERFAEGIAKATNNNPIVFIPFGFGPQICTGMNFATHKDLSNNERGPGDADDERITLPNQHKNIEV
ncbi:hypothetical protein NL676_032236 [Syzygium grande]|nr:hypothetical protein NL676_032236 [Syzygium grande]